MAEFDRDAFDAAQVQGANAPQWSRKKLDDAMSAPLGEIARRSSDSNPSKVNRTSVMAQKHGISDQTALTNANQIEIIDLAQRMRSSPPVTRQFLMNEMNAKMARDDVDNLAHLETVAEENRKYLDNTTFMERLSARVKEGAYGIAQMAKTLPKLGAIERGSFASEYGDFIIAYDPMGNPIYASQSFMPEEQREALVDAAVAEGQAASEQLAQEIAPLQAKIAQLPQRPATQAMMQAKTWGEIWDAFLIDPVGIMGDIGVSSGVQQLPALAVTVATRNPTVAFAAMGSNSYSLELGHGVVGYLGQNGVDITSAEAITEALKDDDTARKALAYAGTRAAIIGGFDAISGPVASLSLLGRSVPGEVTNTLLAQPVVQGILGAAGEAGGQLATEGNIGSPGEVFAEFIGEYSQAPIEAAAFAYERIAQSQADEQHLDSISQAAQMSKLRAENPEKFRELVARLGEKYGDTVYLDPEGAEVFFQSNSADPDVENNATVQAIVGDIANAKTEGRDIEIPIEAYATDIAGTNVDEGLRQFMRTNPDAMTPSEAANTDVQQRVNEIMEMEVEQRESELQVYNEMLGQELGRGVERSRAELHAAVTEAIFSTAAKSPWSQEQGFTAMDLYQQRYKQGGSPLTAINQLDPALKRKLGPVDTLEVMVNRLSEGGYPTEEEAQESVESRAERDEMLRFEADLEALLSDAGLNYQDMTTEQIVQLLRGEEQANDRSFFQRVTDFFSGSKPGDDEVVVVGEDSGLQARKGEAKATVRQMLADGVITESHAFRGTSFAELKAIAETGQLQIGEDYEGVPGISASTVSDGNFPLYGDGFGFIVPPDSVGDSGRFGEVLVDASLDPSSLTYIVEGEAMTFDQMKDAIGSFDQSNQSILYQMDERNALGLYSPLGRYVSEMNLPEWKKPEGQAKGSVVWQKIKSGPLKQEELQWIGVEEFLTAEPDAKFTREQVENFISENGVVIEEVVATEDDSNGDTSIQWGDPQLWDEEEAWVHNVKDILSAYDSGEEYALNLDVEEWLGDWLETDGNDFVDGYKTSLPKDQIQELEAIDDVWNQVDWLVQNGYPDAYTELRTAARDDFEEAANRQAHDDYMESPIYTQRSQDFSDGSELIIFGNDDIGYDVRTSMMYTDVIISDIYSRNEAEIQAEDYAREQGLIGDENNPETARWSDYIMEGESSNYRELKLTLPEVEGGFYNEAHFPDRNILAFLRVTDRELLDGSTDTREEGVERNTYFIDEFQSDWASAGRKEGFKSGEDAGELEIEAGKYDDLFTNLFSDESLVYVERTGNPDAFWNVVFELARNDWQYSYPGETGEMYGEILSLIPEQKKAKGSELVSEIDKIKKQVNANRYGVAPAPFVMNDNWLSLGLKRAIVDAVENGYEAIAWPNAQTLQDRWSANYDYTAQYDRKMPSIIKKLTKQEPIQLSHDGEPVVHQELGYWIVPVTDELRTRVQENGLPMFQQSGSPKGWYDTAINQITLTKNQDLSTFLHEIAHVGLGLKIDLAAAGDTEAQADLDKLKKSYFNSNVIGKREHEMFASGFEAYLMEGKAPTPELQSIFSRLRQWMLMLYKRIEEVFRRNPDVPRGTILNDEAREIMGRMLATQEEIDRGRAQNSYNGLPIEELGLTDVAADRYRKALSEAQEEAENDAMGQVMRDLARERERWWRNGVDENKAKIAVELADRPEYQARDYLTGDRVPEGVDPVKLNTAVVADILDRSNARKLNKMTAETGVHPDAVAPMFGYHSGDEMVRALAGTMNKRDRAAWIQAQAEQKMRDDNPGMMDEETLRETAEHVLHNEKQANVMAMELRALNDKLGPRFVIQGTNNSIKAQYREAARQKVSSVPVRKIKPSQYLRNEQKFGRQAIQLAAEGKWFEARQAKQKQLFNFYAYSEAAKAEKAAESHRRRLRQMAVTKYSARRVDSKYIQAIKALSAAYDMRKNPMHSDELLSKAKAFIEAQKVANPDLIANDLLERITSWQDMTLEELQALRDAAENLLKIGKANSDAAREEYRREVDEIEEHVVAHTKEAKKPVSDRSSVSRARKWTAQFAAAHRKLESLLQQADGWQDDGPLSRIVFDKLWNAQISEVERLKTEHQELNDIFEGFSYLFSGLKENLREFDSTSKYVDTYEMPVNGGRNKLSLSRAERIVLVLNWGNEGNREALRNQHRRKMADSEVVKAISTLTPEELALVNRIWEYVDKFYPEIAKLEHEATGVAPRKVESEPFVVNGIEMRGGYYPLQADHNIGPSHKAEVMEVEKRAEKMKSGGAVRASTKHGSTIEREGWGSQVVDLAIDTLFRHVDGLVHDITHREAVMKGDRILRNPKIRDAISDSIGSEHYKAIMQSLTRLAGGNIHPSELTALSKIMRFSRVATSYGAMGYSLRTALLNITGMFPAIPEVGKRRMASAIANEFASPLAMGREIKEKSSFMANRAETINRDVYTVLRNLKGSKGWNAVKANAFVFIQKVDAFVSRAVWMAAYNKAIEADPSEEAAVKEADRTVARTQGTGMKIDLSAVEDQSEVFRALSPMYTYFNAILNLGIRQGGKRKTGQIGTLKYAENMLWIFVITAMIEEMMFGADDDDEFNEEDIGRYAGAVGGYYAGQWFGIRELSSYIQYGQNFESPMQKTFTAPLRFGGENMALLFDPDAEFDKSTLRAYTDMLPVLGVPAGAQINRTASYLMDLEDSGEDLSPFKLLLTGREEDTDLERLLGIDE